ncbi:MAG: hypothetical protein R6X02_34760 [Enhygromyxa sp.]
MLELGRTTFLSILSPLFAAAVFAAGGLSACFIEPAQPSTFRFQCSKSDECSDGETCADGLCQQPCGASLEACENGTVCINNFCSSICPLDQDVCPVPQECVAPPSPDDAEQESNVGICMVQCDDQDHPCGEGQLCFQGFCVTLCTSTDECGSGEECTEVGPGVSVCASAGAGGGGRGFP